MMSAKDTPGHSPRGYKHSWLISSHHEPWDESAQSHMRCHYTAIRTANIKQWPHSSLPGTSRMWPGSSQPSLPCHSSLSQREQDPVTPCLGVHPRNEKHCSQKPVPNRPWMKTRGRCGPAPPLMCQQLQGESLQGVDHHFCGLNIASLHQCQIEMQRQNCG